MPRRRSRSKSEQAGSKAGGCVITAIFGGGFAAAGTAMFIFFTVLPLWNIYQAQRWVATPCTITHSQVETHAGSDNDTYSIDIRFSYDYNGKRYNSDRYRFAPPGSSSGYDGKRKVVAAHPVGSQHTCYVDPNDPARAVINRGLTAALWWGLFPLPFMAVGFGVLYAGLTGKIKVGGRNHSGWRPDTSGNKKAIDGPNEFDVDSTSTASSANSMADQRHAGPVILDPGKSRSINFFAMTLFALIWNGIVGVIAFNVYKGLFNGGGFDIEMLFIAPFIIVGLIVLFISMRSLMLIFAPRVILELGRTTLPLGGSTTLRWHVDRPGGRVEAVTIALVGEEHATYRQGTNSSTDTAAFFEQPLVQESIHDGQIEFTTMIASRLQGEVLIQIPQDTMHSLSANNNKIVWKLVVKAKIARWPDPKDEYELVVLPLPITGL